MPCLPQDHTILGGNVYTWRPRAFCDVVVCTALSWVESLLGGPSFPQSCFWHPAYLRPLSGPARLAGLAGGRDGALSGCLAAVPGAGGGVGWGMLVDWGVSLVQAVTP